MRAVAAIRVVAQLTVAALTVAILLVRPSPEPVVVATWVGVLVADALVFRYAWRCLGLRFEATTTCAVISTLRKGSLYLLGAAVTQIIINFDLLVLGATRPPSEAGVYSAAYRVSFFISATIGIAVMATMPELIRRWKNDRLAFARLLQGLLELSARLGAVVLTGGLLFGPTLIQIFYGNAFHSSQTLFQILLATVPLGFINSFLVQAFYAAGRPGSYLTVAGITAALVAVSLLFLVPRYGAFAAAVIAVAAECNTMLAAYLVSRRLFVVRMPPIVAALFVWTLVPLALGGAAWFLTGSLLLTLGGWLAGVSALEMLDGRPMQGFLKLLVRGEG